MNSSPLIVVAYLVCRLGISRKPWDWSWMRYFWQLSHERFVLYMTRVLFCGCLQRLSISAVICGLLRIVLLYIDFTQDGSEEMRDGI